MSTIPNFLVFFEQMSSFEIFSDGNLVPNSFFDKLTEIKLGYIKHKQL